MIKARVANIILWTAIAFLAVAFTLQGAICFLIGSLLMLPETALEERAPGGRQNSQITSQPNSH